MLSAAEQPYLAVSKLSAAGHEHLLLNKEGAMPGADYRKRFTQQQPA